jgi:hypothetical protein
MAEPAGPMTFRCPLAVRSTSHPPAARQRRSPWLPWSASVSGLLVSSAPYQLTSASRGTVHDVIVDSAPSARKPQATLQRRGATPVGPRAGPVDLRAGSVPQRSRTGISGHQRSPTVQTNRQVIGPFRLTEQRSCKQAMQIVLPKVADLAWRFRSGGWPLGRRPMPAPGPVQEPRPRKARTRANHRPPPLER